MDILSDDELRTILGNLNRLTEKRLIEWSEMDEHRFGAEVGDFQFKIRSKDRDDLHPFVLEVSSSEGLGLAQMASDEWDKDANDELEHLYVVVKRRTLGLENIGSSVLDALKSLEQDE